MSPLRPGAKNPTSFLVDGAHWYDFGSATGGDVIDLAAHMRYDGDVGKAIRALGAELGIRAENTKPTWRSDIQRLCSRTAAYNEALTAKDYDYLNARGLSREDVERLMIGRVTDGYLKGRLFLPYFKNGAVVYYATRAMPGGSLPDSKYMKASLKECASYEHIPWGLHTLNRRSDTLIISEGYFDAAVWEREGYPVLSPITGNFSATQWPDVIAACKMFSKVLIIFDNDDISHAGENFTERTANRLFKHNIPFLVARTPPGVKDVNDYYTNGGSLCDLVSSAQDGLAYMVSRYNNATELEKFVLTIHRHIPAVTIASALSTLKNKFSDMELKAILKTADRAPTESEISDEIIRQYQLVYVDNVGFYEWGGKVWQKISDEAVKHYADNAYGKRFTSAQRTAAVCRLLKARALSKAVFDRKPVLTFQNGTLDIENGNFRDFSPNDFCSICMDYDYDSAARCPEWEKFIVDITDDEPRRQEILQFIAGYVLFSDCRHQKVFILVGSGGNGKSVYLEVIQRLFGNDNVTHVEPTGLAQDFQRIRLKDSLLNIGSDINSDFSRGEIREWLLKVADGTSIQACYKGLNHIDFVPRCKLVYACNALPSAEIINGLNRRMQFVDFPCQYVETPDPKKPKQRQRDINILDKLVAELPGIFNWAYSGYKLLSSVGYFTDAPEQDELMRQFEETSNPVMVFCEDFDGSFRGTVSRGEIYGWYKDWCETTGHKALSREKFIPKFRDCMGTRITNETRQRIDGRITRTFTFNSVAQT